MSQIVKFVNKSGERVSLYREDGSIFKIIENIGWDRDPKFGSLRTGVISQHENPPPPQADPMWINEVEWVWEDCPDSHPYAPYKTIIFLAGNRFKLKRRLFWKLPEMNWPVVSFLFESNKMKFIRERLERDFSSVASFLQNGIPIRKTVSSLSKYAEYRKWVFLEQPIKNPSPKQIGGTEIIQFGESLRSKNELDQIAELRAKEEERKKAKFV